MILELFSRGELEVLLETDAELRIKGQLLGGDLRKERG